MTKENNIRAILETHFAGFREDLIESAVKMIMRLEERHGHWTLIDKGHNFYDWECSICGGSGRGDYDFCPYCGAVMDEDIPIEYFENGGI